MLIYDKMSFVPLNFFLKVYNLECLIVHAARKELFQMPKQMAGIQKEVLFHSMRHSFATHLLEKGTDIKYIKEILGHFNIKTTERYLHVSRKQLANIVNPFDDLWLKEGIDW